jgi:hypothetical protein
MEIISIGVLHHTSGTVLFTTGSGYKQFEKEI